VMAYRSVVSTPYAIRLRGDGYLEQLCISLEIREALSAMEMLTRPTSRPWFWGLRCGWPKHVPSIVLSERLTASAFALSKSLGGNQRPLVHPIRRDPHPLQVTM